MRFNACMDNSDFEAFDGFHRLGDSEARVILSYSMDPNDRGSVAAHGSGFTIEQRVQMATYKDSSEAVATLLMHYSLPGHEFKANLPRHLKATLYKYLTPEDKWLVVLHSPLLDDNESLDLILGSGNEFRLAALKQRPFVIKLKRELAILNSIDDDETLARALCFVKFVRNYDLINQVKRIKDRRWVNYVLENSGLEEAQMLRLMGF